jgi:hypothetical protein
MQGDMYMKEPIHDMLETKNYPACPWCGSFYDDTPDNNSEQMIITCWNCNEQYASYPSVKYQSYPIESEEN